MRTTTGELKPVRIVVVSWRDLAHPQAGGSELLVDRLLQGLAGRGHDVALVCGGPVAARGYPVYDAGGTYSQYLKAPVIISTLLRKADLVIDVENGLPFLSPLWRRRPSVCLVLHNHGDQWAMRFPRPVARVARAVEHYVIPAIYRRRLFVAISSSTAEGLQKMGVDGRQVRVVEPGVDLSPRLHATTSQTPLFVSLTRLVPHKRVDVLLDAWREVQPVIGGRFVVVGDGPELDGLRRRAAGIPGAELVGRVEDAEKERWFQEAWFLVHGAQHEGWGIVILEAAAAGIPTVAFDAPGVRDAVVDGKTGILVDGSEGSKVELATKMARQWIALATDRVYRAQLGGAARQRAIEYGWDRMVDSWEQVAKEAVTLPGSGLRSKEGTPPPAPAARSGGTRNGV